MTTIAIITFLTFLILGAPVSFAIGLSGLLAIVMDSDALSFMVVQQAIRSVNSFSLVADPLFILVGEILRAAELSKRILDSCRAYISQFRGGLGMVSVMANMTFAGISGSGIATMSAVSTPTAPELKKAGYDRAFIVSMIAGSSALTPITLPSTNTTVYASLTGSSVGKLFMGGIIPGLLISFALMDMCYWYVRKYNVDVGANTLGLYVVWKPLKDAFSALIIPIITIAGVVLDIFTATESGIIAYLYALICGLFACRILKLRDLLGIFKRATSSSAILMTTMGIPNICFYMSARENPVDTIKTFMLSVPTNPTVAVLITTGTVLVIGCFMETLAATAVILPIVYLLMMSLGVDPLMLGVLFSIATVVEALMLPVGLYLFLSVSIIEAPLKEAIRYTVPVVLIILVVMVLMLIWPPLVTFVPHLLMGTRF